MLFCLGGDFYWHRWRTTELPQTLVRMYDKTKRGLEGAPQRRAPWMATL
jgi:hypothetical protein